MSLRVPVIIPCKGSIIRSRQKGCPWKIGCFCRTKLNALGRSSRGVFLTLVVLIAKGNAGYIGGGIW